MTSRITHERFLPKNVAYWDYFILCRLNTTAALALQRMEYWDGTKADSNIHGEQINEHLVAAGKPATQDTSRFVYKSQEELSWELIGCCCERALPKIVDMLLSQLRYLTWRKNPHNILDHTRQYCFQAKLVQSHLDRLSHMVKHFLELGRMSVPVLYAIEELTAEGYYVAQMTEADGQVVERTDVELLSIERIAKKLRVMHQQMHEDEQEAQHATATGKKFKYRLPRFVRLELKKDEARGFSAENSVRDGKFAVPRRQICGTETVILQEGDGNFAGTIPVITTVITNSNYEKESITYSVSLPRDVAHANIAAPALDFSSLLASVATLSDEQKQQLQAALLTPVPAPAVQEEVPPAPSSPPATSPEEAQIEAHRGEKEQNEQGCTPPPETQSKPAKDPSLAGRIEAVFFCLDRLAQQTTGDSDFTWTRSERAKRSVKQLLAGGRVVTPEKLAAVYLHMATMKPDPKTGFTWANKMSVANVCNNYDSIWLELVKAKQPHSFSAPGEVSATPSNSAGTVPLRTLVVYGSTDNEMPSHPLPVVSLRRDLPRRQLVGRGV